MMLATGFLRVDCAMTLQRLYSWSSGRSAPGSRYARIPGVTASPDEPQTVQQVRILLTGLGDRTAGFAVPGP
jgi:hypothetical protein